MTTIADLRSYFGLCRTHWRHDWLELGPGRRRCACCGAEAKFVADACGWTSGYWELVHPLVDEAQLDAQALKDAGALVQRTARSSSDRDTPRERHAL